MSSLAYPAFVRFVVQVLLTVECAFELYAQASELDNLEVGASSWSSFVGAFTFSFGWELLYVDHVLLVAVAAVVYLLGHWYPLAL